MCTSLDTLVVFASLLARARLPEMSMLLTAVCIFCPGPFLLLGALSVCGGGWDMISSLYKLDFQITFGHQLVLDKYC